MHQKAYFTPILKEQDGSILNSKYGGFPYLNINEEWPKCTKCNTLMPLILQLNLQGMLV